MTDLNNIPIFQNKVLNKYVNFYYYKDPYITKVFTVFKTFLKIVDVICIKNNTSSKILDDFIAGLIFMPISNNSRNWVLKNKVQNLLEPMTKEFILYFKSDDWVKSVIDSELIDFELEIQLRENIKAKVKLSTALRKYIKKNDLLPMPGESIFNIQEDFLDSYGSSSKKQEDQIASQEHEDDFSFKNNFDLVSREKVYSYFKENLVDNNMLSEEELNSYLKLAFEKKVSQSLFVLKNLPSKKNVYKIFYKYYRDIAGKPHGRTEEYAALLGDYFVGYNTQTILTNFSKSMY